MESGISDKNIKNILRPERRGRIYIPQEIRGTIGWGDHEGIVLEQEDGKLNLTSENKAGREAKQ